MEYVTSEGRKYYWNSSTNMTQWDQPTEGSISHPSSSHSVPLAQSCSAASPLSGTNLFIFHLPNEWTEDDLSRSFSPFGKIVSARIMTDKATGRSRGFGFVSYDNPPSALSAVRGMNGFSVLGKRLKVQLKKENQLPR